MLSCCPSTYVYAYTSVNNVLARVEATFAFIALNCLQCFDAVGWAAGRASGL